RGTDRRGARRHHASRRRAARLLPRRDRGRRRDRRRIPPLRPPASRRALDRSPGLHPRDQPRERRGHRDERAARRDPAAQRGEGAGAGAGRARALMRAWKAVVLINLALVVGVGCGYVSWGLRARHLERELAATRAAAAATLFITNTKSDSVSVIDTDTLDVVGTIPLGRGKPNRIVFQPDGTTAWVVYDKTHDLGLIDADARKLVRRVKIGGNPYNLA